MITWCKKPQALQWLVSAGLALATVVAYLQVVNLGFVEYDDGDYVVENAVVQGGLSGAGLSWAFGTFHASNWHPLTWLSHMLDCEFFGMAPAGHHLTSLCFHVANVLLLFALLRQLTGSSWPSALVAALFGLHPLHVESVAWIAERKDVLSTFFGLLSLLAYHRFQSSPGLKNPRGRVFYALSLLSFALGLMSKPMLVTLPFVLLLLDYWPGRRFAAGPAAGGSVCRRLLSEKIPFFALSGISCILTYFAQRGSTVMPLQSFGLPERLGNAVAAYALYLKKMVWPTDLAFFYPLVDRPLWQVVLSGLLLAGLTLAVVATRHRYPFALVGWFWFVGMLVPVIGLVQVGEQSMADRYTYLPAVGLFIIVVWCARQWLQARKGDVLGPAVVGVALLALLACGIMTWRQVACWKNSRSLLERALAVTKNNFLAHNNLGFVLAREGNFSAAIAHFEAAIRIKPTYARAHRNLAAAFVQEGKLQQAIDHYTTALELQPTDVEALHNLGAVLARQGKLDEAADLCSRAVALGRQDPLTLYDYGLVLSLQGKYREAATWLSESARIRPQDPLTHFQLGLTLTRADEWSEAAKEFERALALQPDWPEALTELAWILATADVPEVRSPTRAVALAEKARQLTRGENPVVISALAAAYASAERFGEATTAAERAIIGAEKAGLKSLAEQTRICLGLYQAGKPWITRHGVQGR